MGLRTRAKHLPHVVLLIVSLLIAKSGKPNATGEELLLPAVSEVPSAVLHKSPYHIIKIILLSNNSVQRHIDEMAENVEETLCSLLRTTEFTLLLDESIPPGNESLLLAYVRFTKKMKVWLQSCYLQGKEKQIQIQSQYFLLTLFKHNIGCLE